MLGLTLILACISAFTLLLLDKVGLTEKVQIYGAKIISKLFECQFCLSFWINCIYGGIASYILSDLQYLLCIVIAVPITRKLL